MRTTIFITSCHPLISRNILSTELLDMLIQSSFEIVLIVPKTKKEFFEESFGGRVAVHVEPLETEVSWREICMRYLSLAALNTKTLNIKRRTEMRGSGKYTRYILASMLMRKCIRMIERITYYHAGMASLFDIYKPTVVFSTDVQSELDVVLLNEARRRSVKSVGMVRSWDNLTSKGIIRVIPDMLAVWNKIVSHEASIMHDVPANRICVVGIPHYDSYAEYSRSDKNKFYKRIGANRDKKIVLVIPIGDRYLVNNTVDVDIVDILDMILPQNYYILVRLPPGDFVRKLEGQSGRFDKDRVLFDRVTNSSSNHIKMMEMSKNDDEHFVHMLYWSDIVVSGPSTAVIDAVYLDRPTVIFGFDGHEERPYLESIRRYYDYDNFLPVLSSGGVRYARTKNDFKAYIEMYMKDQSIDRQLRRNLALMEVEYFDGRSTQRLYRVIMDVSKQ